MRRELLDDGRLVVHRLPVLDCGCSTAVTGTWTMGYGGHPTLLGRCRSYFCLTHRSWTYEEPSDHERKLAGG